MMNPRMFMLLLLLFPICLLGQIQQKSSSNANDIYAFRICNSRYNLIVRDDIAIEKQIEAAIYPSADDSKLNFAIRMLKDGTSSFGELNCYYTSTIEETDTTYKKFTLFCDWKFQNDYDNKTGTAELFIDMYYLEAITQVVINCYWDTGRFSMKGYALNTDAGMRAYYLRKTEAEKKLKTTKKNNNTPPLQKKQAEIRLVNYMLRGISQK